jgi:hypothetical protein
MKNSIALAMINQSAIRGLKHSLLAGLDGRVAYECLDECDGGNFKLVWIVYQLASLSNQLQSAWIVYWWMYVVESIAISLDPVSMDVNSGFNDRFDGEFNGRLNLAVLGYWPQQRVRQLRQEAKQTRCLKLTLPSLLNKFVKAIIIVTWSIEG